MDLQPKNQESVTDILRKEMSSNSEDPNLIKDLVLTKDPAKVIDIVSQILNSDELSETIKVMEKAITAKDEDLQKNESQIKELKGKTKEYKTMAKKSVTEFRRVTKMISEMQKNNGALDKKLSLEKICQLLDEMSLHDYETTELLSNISTLRELALETDIIIKKLAKLRRKTIMSEGEFNAKMTIMSLHGYEKIFRLLRIFIKRFYRMGENKI